MAASQVSICNLALAEISALRITSIDEATNEARFCRTHYEQVRNQVLRAHPWNFAAKRATLSALAEAPAFGWARQFQLPTDFLRLLQLNDEEDDSGVVSFQIEGKLLLTDAEEARIRYTATITDEAEFDALFIDAFATRLAAKIARPITGGQNDGAALLERYEKVALPTARRADANEGKARQRLNYLESNLVRSRYGSNLG